MMEKEHYEKIIRQLVDYEKEIRVDCKLSSEEMNGIMYYIKSIDPSLFHVGAIQFSMSIFGGLVLRPEYLYTEEQYKQYKRQISERIRPVKQYLKSLAGDKEKEKYVHDYLCKTVKYVDNGEISHHVVGPLLYGEGVCDGISQAAQLLLKSCGVKSYLVTGSAFDGKDPNYGPHAWNVVSIDGKWYHLDVTYDIGASTDFVRYDYFNLNNAQISTDHKTDYSPIDWKRECVHDNDYYVERKISFNETDTLKKYFRHVFKKRRTNVQIRMDMPYSEKVRDQVMAAWNAVCRETFTFPTARYYVNEARCVFGWYIQY